MLLGNQYSFINIRSKFISKASILLNPRMNFTEKKLRWLLSLIFQIGLFFIAKYFIEKTYLISPDSKIIDPCKSLNNNGKTVSLEVLLVEYLTYKNVKKI